MSDSYVSIEEAAERINTSQLYVAALLADGTLRSAAIPTRVARA